jgi:hypothetical protein
MCRRRRVEAHLPQVQPRIGLAGIERQRTLEQSLADVEVQIVQARDALARAFEEMKRYETVAANRERLRMNAAARRERLETDAIAIENFRRRANGS